MENFIPERRNPRIACAMPATAHVDQFAAAGICRTLSSQGTFFAAILPLGQKVELTIHLPRVGMIKAEGEVRYHSEHALGAGSGITFTRLSEPDLDRVKWFVASYVELRR